MLKKTPGSSFLELANMFIGGVGVIKRELGNLGGWLQFGGVFPVQKADVWPTPGNSVFS